MEREDASKLMEEARLKALSDQRSEVYGDPLQSHIAIGLAWEGIFRNRYQAAEDGSNIDPGIGVLFPPDLVALMMAAFKNVRAARPIFKADSYDDAAVYLGYSRSWRS